MIAYILISNALSNLVLIYAGYLLIKDEYNKLKSNKRNGNN